MRDFVVLLPTFRSEPDKSQWIDPLNILKQVHKVLSFLIELGMLFGDGYY